MGCFVAGCPVLCSVTTSYAATTKLLVVIGLNNHSSVIRMVMHGLVIVMNFSGRNGTGSVSSEICTDSYHGQQGIGEWSTNLNP